MKKGKNNMFF